jgi:aldoxime dehydratase
MTRCSKPANYVPPYPAYQVQDNPKRPDIVLGMIAVQARNGSDTRPMKRSIRQLLLADGAGRPLHFDQSSHTDSNGAFNHIFMPYWARAEDQSAFWARKDVADFCTVGVTGDVGWWSESFFAPTTSLDGNYAICDVKYGIGRHSEMKVEQYHGYMGSMRDRVPDYLSGKADGAVSQLLPLDPAPDTLSKTVRINELPHNLCFIRSGFAWKDATPEEQAVFERDMMPVYQDGADYLRDSALESNCISMRKTDEIHDDADNGVQSNAIGWFLGLGDLERWTREHPRHLAIMKTIMGYMAQFNFEPKLNLGHEVVVIPKGQLSCLYANCHPQTGFLPYFL